MHLLIFSFAEVAKKQNERGAWIAAAVLPRTLGEKESSAAPGGEALSDGGVRTGGGE